MFYCLFSAILETTNTIIHFLPLFIIEQVNQTLLGKLHSKQYSESKTYGSLPLDMTILLFIYY